MATNTPNYSLVKPDSTDIPDIAVLNGNMDKVDAQMKANATNIGLFASPTTVTWAADDRIWHQKPQGIYYVSDSVDGTAASSAGYEPYSMILHMITSVNGTVYQLMLSGSAGVKHRRFSSTQSMAWLTV